MKHNRLIVWLFVCLAGGVISAYSQLTPTNAPALVTLAWDQSTDATVTGYRVYWGGSGPKFYTNFVEVSGIANTTVTIGPLVRGTTYYFAATAIGGGLESDFSNEVSYTPRSLPPAPVLRLAINGNSKTITATGERYANYVVERAIDLTGEWAVVSTVQANGDGVVVWADTNQPLPQAYYRMRQS